jgi:hypothetical protein
VWVPRTLVDEMSLLFSTIQQSEDTDENIEAYKPIAKIFLDQEMSQLEQANIHTENLNYYTAKKLDTLRSKLGVINFLSTFSSSRVHLF